MDQSYFPYRYEDQDFDRGHHAQGMLQALQEKRQRLVMNLQSYPYQRNEIESQIRQVDREIQQCHDQFGPVMDSMTYVYPPKGSGHGSYMSPVDSAIASGATSGVTTKAPSVVAEDDLEKFEDEQFPNPQSAGGFSYQGYSEQQPGTASTNEQIVQGRPDRIRMTMFPDDGMDVPSTQMMRNQPTNLQRLSQPAQILKAIVSGLATYQGSSEMTSQVLPELAKLLNSVDESVVLEAARLVMELAKKEASCRAIVASEMLVSSLIKAMSCTGNADIQKSLSGTLHNVSNDRHGQLMIYNCGGIPYLVRLLTSQVNAVLFYAITTLHNMLLHYEPAKMDVRLAGGLEKMVALLVKDNPKFLAINADCLHLLAYGHQDSKLIILASGGPSLLVRIMRLYTYEKLLWTCSRLLKVLSVCPSNKPEIVQAGGMQALASHLGHKSTRLVQNILFTTRNLSDAATKQDHLDDLLKQLIMLLGSNDVTIVTCSAGVLSNLTCNNPKNKTIVCKLQGVEALLRAINNSGGREDIIEAAVCALRHITSRHPSAEVAQNSVRLQNGIPMLTNFMQQQCRWPLMQALLGLVRNLALTSENLPVLFENQCVESLWHILNRANQESHRRGHPGGPSGYIDGIYMDEVVEITVGAMHLMAKDMSSRLKMKQLNCIPIFVQLLHSPRESITRVAAGVLCELSQDAEGAALIEKQNATAPLTELLHSRNESVAAYAAAVLFCLSEDSRKQTIQPDVSLNTVQLGYYAGGGSSIGQSMSAHVHGGANIHSASGSHPDTGYTTPNDVSGLLTPEDLDLPLDFGAFDDFPVTDSLHGFTSHPPSVPTPHTYHHTAQASHQPQQQPVHPSHGHSSHGYPYPHHSYNPPSPAVMDTAPGGGQWFDSDL